MTANKASKETRAQADPIVGNLNNYQLLFAKNFIKKNLRGDLSAMID